MNMKGRLDGHVFLFSAASAVFAKSDSFKIFLYGLEVQQGTVLRTGRNKTTLWKTVVQQVAGRILLGV